MNTYDCIPQFAKMLKNLDGWLVKASDHATIKKFEIDTLAHARLAPDQYSLVKQVQAACDSAKFSAAYLSGKEAQAHPDNETTIAQLRERIQKCASFLETVTPKDFEGADERKVAPKWLQGKWMRGDQYLTQAGIPNFYFHVTTAYQILRHNGVDVGKMDFIGSMPLQG